VERTTLEVQGAEAALHSDGIRRLVMTTGPGLIVVGVDGSRRGVDALAFALDEAARCGDSVEMVTAWIVDLPQVSIPVVPVAVTPPAGQDLTTHAEEIQDRALAAVGAPKVGVSVARRVVHGDAGRVLVEASRNARLLVVGSRSLGPVSAALLGSVSGYCARHAACPVVVVPDRSGQAAAEAEALLPRTTTT
jgi:nucleotide-binding universal stress UspA family protein